MSNINKTKRNASQSFSLEHSSSPTSHPHVQKITRKPVGDSQKKLWQKPPPISSDLLKPVFNEDTCRQTRSSDALPASAALSSLAAALFKPVQAILLSESPVSK